MSHRFLSIVALSLAALSPAAAHARGGFYVGLGLGGAIVSGPGGVDIDTLSTNKKAHLPGICPNNPKCVTGDFGDGFAAMFRVGYNFFGVAGLEVAIPGHANLGSDLAWMADVLGTVTIHPMGIVYLVQHRKGYSQWDPYALIGGGVGWGGYVSEIDHDDKGWFMSNFHFGAGLDFYPMRLLSVGVDLRVLRVQYHTWIYNRSKGIEFDAKGSPHGWVILPTVNVALHVP